MPPDPFVRVQFRGIGRKQRYIETRVIEEEAPNPDGTMNRCAIPDQYDVSVHMPKEMAKEFHDLLGANRAGTKLKVQLGLRTHRGNG